MRGELLGKDISPIGGLEEITVPQGDGKVTYNWQRGEKEGEEEELQLGPASSSVEIEGMLKSLRELILQGEPDYKDLLANALTFFLERRIEELEEAI